jgi:polysaccharide deacetylase 2 family uncharacterized protein YibQ
MSTAMALNATHAARASAAVDMSLERDDVLFLDSRTVARAWPP